MIGRSVVKWLERSNSNHPDDLIELLRKTQVELSISDGLKSRLAAMMIRRHWIAHRVDRDLSETGDPGRSQSGLAISPELVSEWKNAVIEVGDAVLKKLT